MASDLIALDIDDVLADLNATVRKRVNKLTGAELSESDYRIQADYWGYYEQVWLMHEATRQMNIELILDEMAQDHQLLPLLAGAQFGLNELSKRYELVFITARPELLQSATRRWLKHHFSTDPDHIHFMNHHDTSRDMLTKGEMAQRLGARYLIDDNVEHCLSAVEQGIKAVLFGDYGWQHSAPDSLVRCADWPAVVQYFAHEG